ncbi:hypothetical protein TNCV_4367751 [Trichonephila clavipes]|nr:hypothetical protein TNCV_4367751 [Trichonephila clavipes]
MLLFYDMLYFATFNTTNITSNVNRTLPLSPALIASAHPMENAFEITFITEEEQGRSYHRTNDTGSPNYRVPKCLTTISLTDLSFLKKGPEGVVIRGPLRSIASPLKRSSVFQLRPEG